MTGLEGSGNKAEDGIREQFYQILEVVIHALKTTKPGKKQRYVHLLNALCWDYTPEDHRMIVRLRMLETIHRGNKNELFSPLSQAWGRERNHFQVELERTENFSLATRLRQVFEFLSCNMFKGIFV